MTGPPESPQSRIALIAWIINWIGDHEWQDCLRLITVMIACAVAAVVLVTAVHVIVG